MKLPELYLLHPVIVHFPIALLSLGLFVEIVARKFKQWLPGSASWLLWLGTLAAWVTVGFGLLAERTAPHIPLAWQTLELHEDLAYWTVGLFSVLSLWRWRLPSWKQNWFLPLWCVSWGVLLATAYQGGELVFSHGMGVIPR